MNVAVVPCNINSRNFKKFGNVSAIGKPPHYSQETVNWKVLKLIGNTNMISRNFQVFWQCLSFGLNLAMCVFGLNCAIFRPLGTAEAVFCRAMQAWQYEFDFKTFRIFWQCLPFGLD